MVAKILKMKVFEVDKLQECTSCHQEQAFRPYCAKCKECCSKDGKRHCRIKTHHDLKQSHLIQQRDRLLMELQQRTKKNKKKAIKTVNNIASSSSSITPTVVAAITLTNTAATATNNTTTTTTIIPPSLRRSPLRNVK